MTTVISQKALDTEIPWDIKWQENLFERASNGSQNQSVLWGMHWRIVETVLKPSSAAILK